MLFLATLHLIADWYRNIYALTSLDTREEARIWLAETKNWSYPLKDFVYGLSTCIGDALLVFRCYYVWNRRLLPIIVPTICFFATLATGNLVVYYEIKGKNPYSDPHLNKAIIGAWSVFILNNVSSTALILLRLWMVRRAAATTTSPKHPTTPVVKMLLETGVVYCLSTIVVLVLFVYKPGAQLIVLNSISSLMPLLFCGMLLKISGRDQFSSPLTARMGETTTQPDVSNGVHIEISRFIEMGPVTRPSSKDAIRDDRSIDDSNFIVDDCMESKV